MENESQAKHRIHVVGSSRLKNELLATCLKAETGFECTWGYDLDLSTPKDLKPDLKCLIVIDCESVGFSIIWNGLGNRSDPGQQNCYVALSDVEPTMLVEKEALDRGIRGIFYNKDSLESLAKGARAILGGELWFSRKILSECLTGQEKKKNFYGNGTQRLTYREKEILGKLVSGASNKQIAEDLCVSPHTVKTHIYKLYKKISANNRVQAALWGDKYL